MRRLRLLPLLALVLVAAACGPGHGLRDAPSADPNHRLDASAAGSDMHLLQSVPLTSPPTSLTSTGSAIWAASSGGPGVVRIDVATGRTGPELVPGDLPNALPNATPGAISVLSTPKRLWILHEVSPGSVELSIFVEHVTTPYARSPYGMSWSLLTGGLTFYHGTSFVGATDSAVWLLGPGVGRDRYVLFRHDLKAARTTSYPITSVSRPVAAIVDGELVDLREPRAGTTVLERRGNPRHPVVSGAPSFPGTLQASSATSCGGDLIGWSAGRGGRGRVVVIDVADAGVRSAPIVPFPARTQVRALATDPSCRSLWVSAAGSGTGAVRRLRLDTLEQDAVLRSADIGSLVWAHGGLWAGDDVHDAVIRIQ
jgi:hypothetical protein